ncbi:MAG: hypothetical protein LBD37_04905 [Treponema sp.]|jgi:HEAT repeat protein|nr:hypothetical protein [Treponema sp.]
MRQTRKRRIVFSRAACLLWLFSLGPVLGAEEAILTAYKRNFTRAGISGKIDILQDAGNDPAARRFIGDFYEFVLQFALRDAELLREDQDFTALVILASRGMGVSRYHKSLDALWRVFLAFDHSAVRVEVLKTMGVLRDKRAIPPLQQYLADQNLLSRMLYERGGAPADDAPPLDYPAVSACIAALRALRDGASFPVLFEALTAGYPESITQEAEHALNALEGDFKPFLFDKMRHGHPEEKLAALRQGNRKSRLEDMDRGELAEQALKTGLHTRPEHPDDERNLAALRYLAVMILQELQWTRAAYPVIDHFYRVQKDYQKKAAPRDRLLEAIACLGIMGNSESAQVLAIQLGLLNAQMEERGNYDGELILGAVKALGQIGDKLAYDPLYYISFLPYPDSIQIAAQEALAQLKW